ncbi:hypothetical protein ACEPAF_5650 [Sanghuangporus sanghuang]
MHKLVDLLERYMASLLEQSSRPKIHRCNGKRDEHQHCKLGALGMQRQCSFCEVDQIDARSKFFSISELLSMVFEYCLPEDDLPTDNLSVPPRLLTHVCRLWREVAFATPHLWARLDLVCFPGAPCRMVADRHSSILSDWFMRSGNCPTSLVLRYFGSSASDVRNISRILAAIIPHSHRWRDLILTAPMPCLRPILQLLGHATPALETCRITITSASASSERDDLVVDLDNEIAFRLNPITLDLRDCQKLKHASLVTDALTDIICVDLPSSLQTLSLNKFDLLLGPTGPGPNFCCTNLRKLTLRSRTQISLLCQLAQAFPCLEEAFFFNVNRGMDSETVPEDYRASIKFPKLRSLSLRSVSVGGGGSDLHALGLCIRVLDVPVLEHLSLTVSYAILQNTWIPLSELLGRVSSTLSELTFIGAYFMEIEFLDLLRKVPELESLKMCVRLNDDVLAALKLPNGQPDEENMEQALCPRLKHLDIPLPSPCLADSVIAMILSRCPPSSPINTAQEPSSIAKKAIYSQSSLQECRLVLSEPGTVEVIGHHPGIVKCIERGLRLDLRAF